MGNMLKPWRELSFLARLAVIYIVLVHVLTATVLAKSNFISKLMANQPFFQTDITPHYRTMMALQLRKDKSIRAGATVIIGDSHTQALAVSKFSRPIETLGISRDTTIGLLNRIPKYKSIADAEIVVIEVGINDLWQRSVSETALNYQDIVDLIPVNTALVLNAVFPVNSMSVKQKLDNSRVVALNEEIQNIARARKRTWFLDANSKLVNAEGDLKQSLHVGDGLHLNAEGYTLWIEALEAVFKTIHADIDAEQDQAN